MERATPLPAMMRAPKRVTAPANGTSLIEYSTMNTDTSGSHGVRPMRWHSLCTISIRFLTPAGLTPTTPPVWKTISHGHSYSWHEDRLHSLAAAARTPGSPVVGRWTIPVLAGGTMTRITGTLWHANAPSLVWFWPIAVVLGCLAAVLRLRDPRLDAAAAAVLATVTLGAATLGRLGRELVGRPTVSAWQFVLVALTCAVAAGLALLFARRSWRAVAGLCIAVLGIYQGVALAGTLLHGFVLSVLPPWLERAAAVTSLAAGAGLLVTVLAGATRSGDAERDERALPGPGRPQPQR